MDDLEDRVQGTILDFGGFQVRRSTTGTKTLLEVTGAGGGNLPQALERLVTGCKGDVGIDLSGLEGITSALVPVLERLRKRFQSLRRNFFLCNPPSRLRDALKLGGIAERYTFIGPEGTTVEPLKTVVSEAPPPPAGVARPGSAAPVEMAVFDRSLKRTERLEQGLDSAARCVRKMLPSREPAVPGYRFAFTYQQSEAVGGDFFDFIHLGDGLLGVSIGDVSGNGLEAAVLMGLAKKVIAMRAHDVAAEARRATPATVLGTPEGEPPAGGPALPSAAEVLRRVNEDLHGDLDRSLFITALFGFLDAGTGTFQFARAGHEKPLLFRPGSGETPRTFSSTGPALAILPDGQFKTRIEEAAVELRPGDVLLLYTDGVVEARSPRGQMFSRDRLAETLRRVGLGRPLQDVLGELFASIGRHATAGAPQDDMTALLIGREALSASQG